MKTFSAVIFLIVLTFFQNISFAQTDDASGKYTQADYEKMIPAVKKAIDWLISNPINQDTANRKKLNEIILIWATGYHGVQIEIRDYINDFSKIDINYLMVFMGGWIKYSLANKDEEDKVKLNAAGLRAIMKVYKLGGEKNEFIESIVQKDKDGNLNDYIEEKIQAK